MAKAGHEVPLDALMHSLLVHLCVPKPLLAGDDVGRYVVAIVKFAF